MLEMAEIEKSIRKLKAKARKSGFTLDTLTNPQFALKSRYKNSKGNRSPQEGDQKIMEQAPQSQHFENTNAAQPGEQPPRAGAQNRVESNPNTRFHVDPRTVGKRAADEIISTGIWVGGVLLAFGGVTLIDNLWGKGARERKALGTASDMKSLEEST